MHKLTLATVAALLSLGASAMAETQNWNITEENSVGIKNAQGKWTVNVEAGKISGKAELEGTNGSPVTYKVEGTVKDGVYTVTMSDRSDGKKGSQFIVVTHKKRTMQRADVIYGIAVGRSFTFFHYRFKIATWMLGRIPNAFMRLPQVPPPADEIAMIYDALVATGKQPVHRPEEFALAA